MPRKYSDLYQVRISWIAYEWSENGNYCETTMQVHARSALAAVEEVTRARKPPKPYEWVGLTVERFEED